MDLVDDCLTLPDQENLATLLAELKDCNFLESQKQPLFAARYWNLGMEREARKRWSAGLSNTSEVAVPRWYWRGMGSDSLARFLRLTLGTSQQQGPQTSSEACLFSDSNPTKQNWILIPRFGRFILANHRSVVDKDYVYFGDDTLFLMSQARDSLSILEASHSGAEFRCLDLCCGGGGVGMSLPGFSGSVVGVDLNERAILAAQMVSKAQGLQNYQYHCTDAHDLLTAPYDLIVGNPPTLDPMLAGAEVFHATGSIELFESLFKGVLKCLKPEGRSILTVFSQTHFRSGELHDPVFRLIEELVGQSRPFQYRVRRVFPLRDSALRHCSVHLYGQSEDKPCGYIPARRAFQLPGLEWRRN